MKKLILALLLTLSLLSPESGQAQSTTTEIAKARASIVKLTAPFTSEEDGTDHTMICTGFVILGRRIVTARHCGVGPLKVNGYDASILNANPQFILLAEPQELNIPPIPFSTKYIIGEEISAVGYGNGDLIAMKRHIAATIDQDILVDGPFIPGMSGGPAVNQKGEVVGITQAANATVGVLCSSKEILDFVNK